MTLIATLASMSTMVTGIGPAFTAIGKIAINAFTDLMKWFNSNLIQPIRDFIDNLSWDSVTTSATNAFTALMEFVGGIFSTFFDLLPNPPPIFSLDFWIGLFTSITKTVGGWAATLWDMLPSLPSFLTLSYWTDLFDFDIDWDAIFNFLLPDWLTWDYWFGSKGIFNFDIGSIFSFDSWTDLLPEWSWADIIPTSISNFFKLDSISTAFDTIGGAFSFALVPITDAINFIIDNLNSILGWNPPGPGGTVSKILGISLLDNLDVPQLAKGGIVNKPTLAMIGEDGPEAVVPLSQRNNPSGAGMGGGTYNITVNAGGITDRTDKRALAREIGNMIQQELARSVGGSTMRGRY